MKITTAQLVAAAAALGSPTRGSLHPTLAVTLMFKVKARGEYLAGVLGKNTAGHCSKAGNRGDRFSVLAFYAAEAKRIRRREKLARSLGIVDAGRVTV